MNVIDFQKKKDKKEKISMITCYDHFTAKIIDDSMIDSVLVGDSCAMVVYGYPSTINATVEMMERHIEIVSRGAKSKFIIGDMPFLSFRKGVAEAMECVESFMRAGAHAVKLEGVTGHEDVVANIVQSGVPVMGHLGLTPQSVHKFGGHKVQGKDQESMDKIIKDAKILEDLGCFSIVLECIPENLASKITEAIKIPTIGIGAGLHVDGQVLVLQDMLGMAKDFNPKFLRKYLDGHSLISNAINKFHRDVKCLEFPGWDESY
ncbi:MAG: 3-methyl-2-oxobutanoate hydroxymethyltransferase [Pseudomonadota bacterium]